MLFAEVPSNSETADTELLIGDYVSAKIRGATLQNVIALPRQSLVDGNAIWIVRDGLIYKQDVDVEWLDDENVVIDAGDLPDGVQVNTTALGYMISGSRVRIAERDGNVVTNTEKRSRGNGNRPNGNRPNGAKPMDGKPELNKAEAGASQ